jgi:hypothetical protein
LHSPLLTVLLLGLILSAGPAHAVAIPAIPDEVRWGESSRVLLERFGSRATALLRPIDFGDSYADVVLRDVAIGGVRLTAFFQMDKASGGLKRMQFERARHWVNPPAYRAVVAALERLYGAPNAACTVPPAIANGYQPPAELMWLRDGMSIRAIFRDTTIEALEGCLSWWMTPPCGLTGQMLIRFAPEGAERTGCSAAAAS